MWMNDFCQAMIKLDPQGAQQHGVLPLSGKQAALLVGVNLFVLAFCFAVTYLVS